ncbi:MAG TPA: hypothetical protein VE710_15515 [Candidatus Bathyarchaeia archaeon]|nr:hypothetical protein [Candidatus Bathyarchaeia archaeon]
MRRGCLTSVSRFCKLHLGGCGKDSARPVLPFLVEAFKKTKTASATLVSMFRNGAPAEPDPAER